MEEDTEIVRVFPERNIMPIDNWGPNHRFVQLNLPGAPGFWVSYETSRQSLMLANGDHSPDFQAAFQAALNPDVGENDWEEYKGWRCPGATILSAAQLAATSDECVLQAIRSAFRIFVRVMQRFTVVHQQESV